MNVEIIIKEELPWCIVRVSLASAMNDTSDLFYLALVMLTIEHYCRFLAMM